MTRGAGPSKSRREELCRSQKMQAAATNAATACCSPQNAVNFPQNGESARDYFKKLKFPNTLSKWADMQRAAEANTPSLDRPLPHVTHSIRSLLNCRLFSCSRRWAVLLDFSFRCPAALAAARR